MAWNDNAPIGNTCPIIDEVIDEIKEAKKSLEYIGSRNNLCILVECKNAISKLENALLEIENVRDANFKLRAWGNEEYDRAEEKEKELEQSVTEKEYLQEEIDEMKEILNID